MTAFHGWPPYNNSGTFNHPPIDWNAGSPLIEEMIEDMEPSAVDRLAALVDPDGEAGKRVTAWKETKESLKQVEDTQRQLDWVDRFSPPPVSPAAQTWGITYGTTVVIPQSFSVENDSGDGGAHVHVSGGAAIFQ